MTMLIGEIGPSRAVVITYVNPVIALILGVALLGEHPGPGSIGGLILILVGCWLSTRSSARASPQPPVARAELHRAASSERDRGTPAPPARKRGHGGNSNAPDNTYLMNRISEYLGSGHRSSATTFSSLSATTRTSAIAGNTLSCM